MPDFKALVAVGGHPAALLISYAYFINSVVSISDPEVALAATLTAGVFLVLCAARQPVAR